MKILFLTFFSIVFFSCNNENNLETVDGVLYIKLIEFNSTFYNAPVGRKEAFIKILDSLEVNHQQLNDKEDATQRDVIEFYRFVRDSDLIDKPYFKMITSKNDTIHVFCEENSYLKLKPLKENLNRDLEVINITFKGRKLKDKFYFADEFISIEKKSGMTPWDK